MHRCQYNKTWSNQDKFPAGNLNWHNVKTMLPSHNNRGQLKCIDKAHRSGISFTGTGMGGIVSYGVRAENTCINVMWQFAVTFFCLFQAEFDSTKGDSSKFDAVVTYATSKNFRIWWIGLKVSEGQADNR